VVKPEGKSALERPMHRLKDNIKIDRKEWYGSSWTGLSGPG
jgi:hypothetical protein